MSECDILNPILHCNVRKFNRVANISRDTWMKNNQENNVFSFFYQGGSKSSQLHGDVLTLRCTDKWNHKNINYVSTSKLIEMLKYCLDTFKFKFLFRTSNSTYVSHRLLSDFLKNVCPDSYYGGKVVVNRDGNITYCLGHGFILSYDLVKLLVSNQNLLLSYDLIDDLAVGKFMMNKDVIARSTVMQKYRSFNPYTTQDIKLIYAHRCKPLKWPISEDEWVDHIDQCFKKLDKRGEKLI